MSNKCQASMTEVRERLRQAQFGYRRTPEELRELEQTISGIRRDPWQKPPHHLKATFDEELAGNDLLQGGGVLQELTRQACFGYARNEKGEQVRLSGAQLRERLREEIQADAIKKTTVAPVAQGASVSQG